MTYAPIGLSILAAVSTIIGVIITNLKTVVQKIGNGLKNMGKKLGQALPGLIGSIASLVFKTAGEVIKFLGQNAWLLIVGVVIFVVEQFKKK